MNATSPSLPRPVVPWIPVGVFVLVAFGLAWLVALPLWLGDGLASPATGFLLPLMMATPAIATLVVVLVARVPREDRRRFLGMRPLRPVRRLLAFLGLAFLLPIVVVVATVAVSAGLGLVELDLSFGGFAELLESQVPAGTPLPPVEVIVASQLLSLPAGALINSVLAFGEEIGWRGWLQTALLPLGVWPALLITGVAWGLWHAPVILLGYNFARPDAVGLLLMVGGCVAWGVLLGWLRLRSASVWPPVLAHGTLNAVAGIIVLVLPAGTSADLGIVGPLGVVAWVLLAITVAVIVLLRRFRPVAPPVAAG